MLTVHSVVRTAIGMTLISLLQLPIAIAKTVPYPLENANSWDTYSRSDKADIYFRYITPDTLQLYAKTEITSCVAAFLHLVTDTERLPEWVSRVSHAHVISQPTPYTHVVHTVFNGVWPIAKRDMVTQSEWQYDAQSGVLRLKVKNASHILAPAPDTLRMTEVASAWELEPIGNGNIAVRYWGFVNPEGRVPRRLARATALRSINLTFDQLASIINEYQQAYAEIPCIVASHKI